MIERTWNVGQGRELRLGAEARIMGILNVTPDSFSDGGRFESVDDAVAAADRMASEGAAIVDVGGESSRPGAEPIGAVDEQRRVLPVIEALAGRGYLVSVDTWRAETAILALRAGAHIVNDIWGAQRDPGIARVAADHGAGLVLMHTGRDRARLPDPIEDQQVFLQHSLSIARSHGVDEARIVLDPGFGFAKDSADNFALMSRFAELQGLGFPLLVGTSRKRFLGAATGRETAQRDIATAATSALLRQAGAAIFRVHDVAANADALRIADAVLSAGCLPAQPS